MKFSDVNIIPHKSNAHTDNTVPHKLFQSIMSGKPVLVSSSDPLKRLVNSTNSGLVFKADDPEDLANKVLLLYKNKNLCVELGKNGLKATTEGELNWDHEQHNLIKFYRSLFAGTPVADRKYEEY
jgi:glycosyltransferase involved in cell wall biosynthesis